MKRVVCLLLLAFFSLPAQAQETSGLFSAAYLRELCKRNTDGKEMVKNGHTACQSYISGVIDYHKLLKSLGTAPIVDFCVPNTTTMSRLQDIVWVFLERNPAHSDFIAAPAVTLALVEYYPCPQPKKRKR